jgi:sensor histidine kinase YesM
VVSLERPERTPTIDLSDRAPARLWWRAPLLWTGAVLLYALVLTVQVGLPASISLPGSAIYLYSLAILSIPVRLWMKRSLSLGRPTPWQLTLYVLAGLATVGLWFWANMLYNRFTIGPGYWEYVYAGNWIFQLLFAVTVYGTVVGLSLTAQAWRRERDRDRREAELMLVAREAELGAIRAQFQPHFVLNALNSLLALIDKDPALARTMVVRLADVMKSVFDRMDVPAVPLERELDLVKAYLDVERIRFGARLSAAFEIEDAARGVLVPPFLLQPIVENAVKHGIAPNAAPGVVRVSANVHNGRLDLEVRDSGTGAASPPGSGRGLALTRRRLETVYHDTYELTFDRQANGTSVRISMPTDAALHVA